MPIPENASPRLRKVLAVAQPVTKAEKRRAIQVIRHPVKPKTSIVIRRAVVTDAVNIYKAWLADDARRNDKTEFDPAARVAYILTTIATGFVVIVEISGRIFGSIGFGAGGAGYTKRQLLLGAWGFMFPQMRRPEVIAQIVGLVNDFADSLDVDIEITVETSKDAEMWEDFDFIRTGVRLVRKADPIEQSESVLPTDEDPDLVSPGASPDNEPEDFDNFGETAVEDDDADDPLTKRRDLPPTKSGRTVAAQQEEFAELDFEDPE